LAELKYLDETKVEPNCWAIFKLLGLNASKYSTWNTKNKKQTKTRKTKLL